MLQKGHKGVPRHPTVLNLGQATPVSLILPTCVDSDICFQYWREVWKSTNEMKTGVNDVSAILGLGSAEKQWEIITSNYRNRIFSSHIMMVGKQKLYRLCPLSFLCKAERAFYLFLIA